MIQIHRGNDSILGIINKDKARKDILFFKTSVPPDIATFSLHLWALVLFRHNFSCYVIQCLPKPVSLCWHCSQKHVFLLHTPYSNLPYCPCLAFRLSVSVTELTKRKSKMSSREPFHNSLLFTNYGSLWRDWMGLETVVATWFCTHPPLEPAGLKASDDHI